MLVADRQEADGSWPDDADPGRRWAFPTGLVLAQEPDGTASFVLARYATGTARGGLLHFALDVRAPADAEPVPWSAARSRVSVRAAGGDAQPVSEWRELPPAAVPLVTVSETLTPAAAQLLDAGLHSAGNVIEVELEARARGVAGRLPALVTIDLPSTAPLLPSGPWTVDELVVALLNLPPDAVTVLVLDAAEPPARDAVLTELAHRLSLDLGRDPTDPWAAPKYRLPDPMPPYRSAYDLRLHRPAVVSYRTTWSVTDWAAGLDEAHRDAAFPRLDNLDPFTVTPVLIVSAVPFDAEAGIRSVQVDLVAPGVAGLPERRSFIFDGSGPSTVRSVAVAPAWTAEPVTLSATASAVRRDGSGTTQLVDERPLASTGTLVTVTPADLGLAVTAVGAEAAVFAIAPELRVTVGDAAATLTAPAVRYLAYLPGDAGRLRVTASGQVLLECPTPDRLMVTAADLVAGDPEPITVTLHDPDGRVAFAAVTLRDPTGNQQTVVLEVGAPRTWPCRRQTTLDPLGYTWRLDWIPRAADGTTAPLVSTDWAAADTTALTVTPGES